MTPLNLRQEDLDLGAISALAIDPDGQRIYLGRRFSGDQARENVAVLTLDPQSGAVAAKRLYRDSPHPLPPTYTQPGNPLPPRRPTSTVTAVLVAPRYRKLYIAAPLDDRGARPAHFLSVYDLDEHGDIMPETLRSYRAAADNVSNPIGIDCMALHPQANILYMAGGGWNAVRYYQLDEKGEPQGDVPMAAPIGGSSKAAMAISPDGTRMYLGTAPATLEVVELENGVPQNPPLQSIKIDDFANAGDTYLRFVHTPSALYAVRPSETGGKPPVTRPLYVLPLDTPGVNSFQHVEGFDHVVLAADPAHRRLWLLHETTETDVVTANPVVDGVELAVYATDEQGIPVEEKKRYPREYSQRGLLATTGAESSGEPVLLTGARAALVNRTAGEQVRFRITRAQPGPAMPLTLFKCRLARLGTKILTDFQVEEGDLSEPVNLDQYLSGQPGQVAMHLSFPPAKADVEYQVEVEYLHAVEQPGGQPPVKKLLVETDRVRGNMFVFLLPGYAHTPEDRAASFELSSEHAKTYRAAAEAVQLASDERPGQFVVSAFGLSGVQGHLAQLDDGVATLRALGINSVNLGAWGGLGASELSRRYKDLSPESSIYSPEFGFFFDFIYDGSLKYKDQTIDENHLREWAKKQAQAFTNHSGVPISRLVRFQIADENGWYYPDVLQSFRRENPTTPGSTYAPPDSTIGQLDWSGESKNAAWISRFQDYVAAHDPGLRDFYGDVWDEVVPVGASQATTPETRRLFYWTMRFFSEQAALGARRIQAALEAAFRPEPAPADPRPEHAKLHVHVNFGGPMDWQWYKPYLNAQGDKNPDQGPDAATGSFNWFDFATGGMPLPSKHTYVPDADARHWSFYGDLLRSAARRDGQEESSAFAAMVPGSSMGDIPAGASYKLLSLLGRGTKIPVVYGFGPLFLGGDPENYWSNNFAAYGPIAEALRLVGRAERVLYPGRPDHGAVAIHLPSASLLWDRQQRVTFYTRELLPLHTALVHDGYTVDFIDDRLIEADALARRGYAAFYLTGPNLSEPAQRAVTVWVAGGGTLVALPGAGAANAFDAPTIVLDELLGLAPRGAWSPVRESTTMNPTLSLSNRLNVVDQRWRDTLNVAGPIPLRDLANLALAPVDFPTLQPQGAQTIATLAPLGAGPARPAITVRQHGRGRAYAYAFFPGWQYWCTATHPRYPVPSASIPGEHMDRLPRHWSTPDRLLATLPARLASTLRPVLTSHAAVEARRLQSSQGIAVVLLNWTGEAISALKVTLPSGGFRRITSVKRGPLNNTSTNKATASVTLPLDDVDVLMLEP